MLNTAIIMGRLVADPELRTTATGLNVTSFTVAVDRRYAKNNEDRQTDYIDVVAWREKADFVTRFFHKGSMIAVQGAIQTRSYEDKNGSKRKAVEIKQFSIGTFCFLCIKCLEQPVFFVFIYIACFQHCIKVN